MDNPICLGSTDLFQHAPLIFILDHKGELVAIDRHGQVVEGIKERDLPHELIEALAANMQSHDCYKIYQVGDKSIRVPCPC